MKIIDVKRVDNDITAILEDGSEVPLSWDYIVAHKPQLEDEYIVEEPVEAPVVTE